MPRRPLRNLPVLAGLIALCFAAGSLGGGSPLRLTVDRQPGGHTLINVAVAFVHLAFDFEHSCPESNGCGGGGL